MSTTLDVVAKHRHSVELRWTLTAGVTSYNVERAEPGQPYQLIGQVRGPLFTDPTCKPDTLYGYRVLTNGITPQDSATAQATTLPNTEFADPVDFFTHKLSVLFARDPRRNTQFAWCRKWWAHPEAAFAVNAMWRSYEAHRPPDDPTEPSNEHAYWLTTIAYPLMAQLWASEQVFRGCLDETGHAPASIPLPHEIDVTGTYPLD